MGLAMLQEMTLEALKKQSRKSKNSMSNGEKERKSAEATCTPTVQSIIKESEPLIGIDNSEGADELMSWSDSKRRVQENCSSEDVVKDFQIKVEELHLEEPEFRNEETNNELHLGFEFEKARQENGVRFFCGDDDYLEESSYSRVVIFACKILKAFYMSIGWVWRKMIRVSSARDDSLFDAEHKGMLSKEDENGANLQESKGEKARRRAEEKRQARLEREQLEEERKQREEFARLVEERRKLKGEKVVAEKDHSRSSTAAREKDIKKEAERKHQDRRKEKDKGSSKNNSDAEEQENRAGK